LEYDPERNGGVDYYNVLKVGSKAMEEDRKSNSMGDSNEILGPREARRPGQEEEISCWQAWLEKPSEEGNLTRNCGMKP
jgi:hypothetical protein